MGGSEHGPAIFISYRRKDSEHPAGRLHEQLTRVFPDEVFMDVNSIRGGDDWPARIDAAVAGCRVLVVVIGKHWAGYQREDNLERALSCEDDWVRREILDVLGRGGAVLPVLVGGATLPDERKLPEPLRGLLQKQPQTIRAEEWDRDVELVVEDIARLAGLEARTVEAGAAAPSDPLVPYRADLARVHDRLVPFFPEAADTLLHEVFVEVAVDRRMEDGAERAAPARDKPAGRPGRPADSSLRSLLAQSLDPEAGSTGRWVVLGEPGAGKTTLARHLAWQLAQVTESSAPVPVYCSLPEWASLGRHPFDLAEERLRSNVGDGPAAGLAKRLRSLADGDGRLWLLLDSLDEVAPEDMSRMRTSLLSLSEQLPRARIAVLTRPPGYPRLGGGFQEAALRPLSPTQQRALLDSWIPEQAQHVHDRLNTRPVLAKLAGNPLMLTLVAQIGRQDRDLPRSRAELYQRAISLLLRRGFSATGAHGVAEPDDARVILQHLALLLQEEDRPSWDVARLKELLWKAREDPLVERRLTATWTTNEKFLEDVGHRSGVLAAHDGDGAPWRFLHRQFRELLAAEGFVEQGDETVLSRVRELTEAEDSDDQLARWSEVLALAASLAERPLALLEGLRDLDTGVALRTLAEIDGIEPEAARDFLVGTQGWDGTHLEFVARGWIDSGALDAAGVSELLMPLITPKRPLDELAYIHFALSAVGREPDRETFFGACGRPVRGDAPVPEFVAFPGGRFLMGSPEDEAERDDDEEPQHEVDVRPFELAATAVTNAQYLAFDPKHDLKRWESVSKKELLRHPAVNVSWWEARLYCAWIGARLPTEAEWERACRAGTTTPFSFGETITTEQVNYDGNYPYSRGEKGEYRRSTVSVGSLPPNAWGLHETHGNVWEWCQDSWHDSYEGAPADGSAWESPGAAQRVLRGGSWNAVARYCRSAYRDRNPADSRFRGLGFRPARSLP